jgi:molybdenum cofactor cytidylyltransferase
MRDLLDIRKFIVEAPPQERLALCTLTKKVGSSYRGVGAKKLVSLSGSSCGLLSGGCLEASIEKTARERWHEMPFTESFSTLSEEDRLLGYQTGCQGLIEILFQQVPLRGDDALEWKEKIDELLPYDPIKLVLIGCGADAQAYRFMGRELGWQLHFIDYRRDLAQAEHFPDERVDYLPLKEIPAHIPEGDRTAVVLMTHNYEADLEILRGLKNHRLGYLGCLGPAIRYQKLKNDLWKLYDEKVSDHLDRVAHAPAGIFSHSSSPSEIALSILAQIQDHLIESKSLNAWTLILAAGASRRFGSVKAHALWRGQTFLERSLKTARSFSGISRTLVVTGGHAEALSNDLKDIPNIYNPDWHEGMGSSIATGVKEIIRRDAKAEMIAILPVDQPLIEIAHLEDLLHQSRLSKRCALTAGKDFLGPPAMLPARYFGLAANLSGENGLKRILSPNDMIAVQSEAAAQDFDHPDDLQRMLDQH